MTNSPMPHYCALYDFVDFKGKEVHLHARLLKVCYPKKEGGGSIYSIALNSLSASDIEDSSQIAMKQLERTL